MHESKEVADIVGISVRTLHHYDEIGLLQPDELTEAGYRIYSESNLATLQQILFFREIGFSLKKIREITSSPSYNRVEALNIQRRMLLEKRSRLDKMITTIEKTIRHEKGEIEMTASDKFTGFDFGKNQYEEEARKRWGDAAVDKANESVKNTNVQDEVNAIYRKLASLRNKAPDSDESQATIKLWYDCLNNNFGNYSLEAFKGLGQMYLADNRFTENIDQFGAGLAKFMSEAMIVFADRNKK
ncbi:MerR family transcriptional regulator [Anaerobacillus sp. CMMVII]|uniref:MerR family transcriptional regulator n=1 Tax=Anaerobacillus sp. CMMVII TaxID=2755588 RepID=UPI0021B77936|nr:MerR family transcriptional regulator [Anaerobacillus sp. CMMVII]MCT8138363.1 MerR family transcriptional regulator [Anaerobacillus sp. CMMVII]